jgi:hypothetical protein
VGELHIRGYQIPGPFGVDYRAKMWTSEVETKDFTSLVHYAKNIDKFQDDWKTYNCFNDNHVTIQLLKKDILKEYYSFLNAVNVEPEDIWINGWFNIQHQGEDLKIHYHATHDNSYLSGNIVLTDNDSSTSFLEPLIQNPGLTSPQFEQLHIKNFVGSLTIFPQWMYHFVQPVKENYTRVTIGFDLFTKKAVDYYNNNHVGKEYPIKYAIKLN